MQRVWLSAGMAVALFLAGWLTAVQEHRRDATLAQATAAGGRIALPRMGVPGVGWLAYIMDPEGNISGVMQPDPSATFTPPSTGCPQTGG